MLLLVIRLLVAPVIVLAGTLVQRRFGHAVGGLMIGLPLTTLPLLWLVAAQRGTAFASSMSGAILAATAAQVVVIWLYARLASRYPAPVALVATLAAFVLVGGPLTLVRVSPVVAAVLCTIVYVGALRGWPRLAAGEPSRNGRYRLGLRMGLAAGFTVLVVSLAGRLGTGLSGLLGAVPVMSLTMAVVTHRELGDRAAVRLLEGITRGTPSYVASMLVVTELLGRVPLGAALLIALAAGVALQTGVQFVEAHLSVRRLREELSSALAGEPALER